MTKAERQIEILKINFIKNKIFQGDEVLVRQNENSQWMIHWFRNIDKDGFHTEEFQETPLRYLLKANVAYMFKKMSSFGDLIGQYDFNNFIKDGK
jgi:hypothetical protein